MAYIGAVPAANYKSVKKQTMVPDGNTNYTLDTAVGSEQEIEVYVNNVRQEPGMAYTVSGTTIAMTGAVSNTDSFYIVYQGKAEQTIGIPEKQSTGHYAFAGAIKLSGSPFIEAIANITTDYTITSGYNALTPGPTTISNGVSVTVSSGSVWSVL